VDGSGYFLVVIIFCGGAYAMDIIRNALIEIKR
jgi:hypothetical protein